MPLFSIPLSGLNSNSDALSVISNNLANLNTTAFKGQNVTFRDLFYKSLGTTGGGDPIEVGAGAAIGSVSSNFSDGNPQSTGIPTDVAIQGAGFFVIKDVSGNAVYTRDGHFKVSDAGDLETQDGKLVMGYRADANGVIGGTLSSIQLNKGLTSPPSATSVVRMNLNLNSATVAGVSYQNPITVYDSLGNTHVLQFTFTKDPDPTKLNQWNYSISMPAGDFKVPAEPTFSASIVYGQNDIVTDGTNTYISKIDNNSDSLSTAASWTQVSSYATGSHAAGSVVYTAAADGTRTYYRAKNTTSTDPTTSAGAGDWTQITVNNCKLATGKMTFDPNSGSLASLIPTGTTPTKIANVKDITLPGVSFSDGANLNAFTWNVLDPSGTPVLTQTAANSSASQPYQDGCSSGTLDDYSVNADGTVEGKFSNGKTIAVAKLALATFSNLEGLERVGGNNYAATLASGEAAVGIPQAGGRGKLAGGSLEMSNVDMSKEFSNLIVTQRGFQANAKVITTFDEVTQAAINLKQ